MGRPARQYSKYINDFVDHKLEVSKLTLKWLFYSKYVFTSICSQPLRSAVRLPLKQITILPSHIWNIALKLEGRL